MRTRLIDAVLEGVPERAASQVAGEVGRERERSLKRPLRSLRDERLHELCASRYFLGRPGLGHDVLFQYHDGRMEPVGFFAGMRFGDGCSVLAASGTDWAVSIVQQSLPLVCRFATREGVNEHSFTGLMRLRRERDEREAWLRSESAAWEVYLQSRLPTWLRMDTPTGEYLASTRGRALPQVARGANVGWGVRARSMLEQRMNWGMWKRPIFESLPEHPKVEEALACATLMLGVVHLFHDNSG